MPEIQKKPVNIFLAGHNFFRKLNVNFAIYFYDEEEIFFLSIYPRRFPAAEQLQFLRQIAEKQ
jgi:hypothetical protein